MSPIPSADTQLDLKRIGFRLCVVIGILYFMQGVVEPTEGLIAQPLRSLQTKWEWSPEQIATFAFFIGLPWAIKPLFGFLIDLLPLWGWGSRGYLLLSSLTTIASCAPLFFMRDSLKDSEWLFPLILTATTAVAISDVAVDGLMVRYGQPLGITGTLQSVQWSCMYAAMIVIGPLGGELSQRNVQHWSFLIASAIAACGFFFILAWRPAEPPSIEPKLAAESVRDIDEEKDQQGVPSTPTFSLTYTLFFLLLWSFNPFGSTMQNQFFKTQLGLEDRWIGFNLTATAFGGMLASIAYGTYCRRIPFNWLLRGSVIAGTISVCGYLLATGGKSALTVSFLTGIAYMTGTLIQLDLAARSCPPRWAATIYSGLMSASNFSLLLATLVGGKIFGWLEPHLDSGTIFTILIILGSGTNAACWWLVRELISPSRQHIRPTRPGS